MSLENIPPTNQIQDILRSMGSFLSFPKAFLRLYSVAESEEPSEQMEEETREDFAHQIRSLKTTLEIIKNLSENVFGQIIILYSEYSKIVSSKPNTIVSFYDIYNQISQMLEKNDPDLLQHDVTVIEIFEVMLLCIYWLSQNPQQGTYCASEKRKAAIRALLFESRSLLGQKNETPKAALLSNAQVAEEFEKLQKLLRTKAQYLIDRSVIHNAPGEKLTRAVQSLQKCDVIIASLTRYISSNLEGKKEMDKNPELPSPRDLEVRFKELEERDSAKSIRKELAKYSSHPPTALGYYFLKQVAAEILQTLNSPMTSVKRAKVLNLARDQIGFVEPVVESYLLTHSNSYEITEWDFDEKVIITPSSFLQKPKPLTQKVDLEPFQSLYEKNKVVRQAAHEFLKSSTLGGLKTKENVILAEYETIELVKRSKFEVKLEEKISSLLSNLSIIRTNKNI